MISALALAGMSVLMIGDSHLATPTYLTTSLHDELTAQGATVHTIGVCGTNPSDWLKETKGTCGGAERTGSDAAQVTGADAATTPIADLIDEEQPDLVVIVIGDTIGAYDKPEFPKVWAWQQVTGLTKAVASTGTSCVWVGPAWGTEGGKYQKTYARVKLLSSFLSSNVAPCTYIDSLTFSKPGEWATTDGQHFTVTGYRHWGKAIAGAIEEIEE